MDGPALRTLRNGTRWMSLGTLVYAPWAYGCTTPETIEVLNDLLAVVLALWVIDLVVSKRPPILPRPLLAIAGALLLIGWWMTLNAPTIYAADQFVFVPRRQLAGWARGSVDQALSFSWMVRATVLLGITCYFADLSLRPVWLIRLWGTISVAGGSIALLGLLQKASGAKMLFWGEAPAAEFKTFFASYYYHANAGAFLNLALPPAIGLALRSIIRGGSPLTRALWPTSALCLVLAVFANTSRVAQLLGVVLLIVLAASWFGAKGHKKSGTELAAIFGGAAVIIVTGFAVAQASHLDQPLERWGQLRGHLPADARWLVAQAAWRGAPDAGWFGLGPGTFRVVFPYFTAYLGNRAAGVWRFLHDDYLQTLLEWGWIGSALWGAFFFGGILMAVRGLKADLSARWMPRRRMLLSLVIVALLAIAVHATVDFPLQIASIQLYVATYLGLCWGSTQWVQELAAADQKQMRQQP